MVGKFSSGKEVEDFDKLAWEMELPAAAILLDNTLLDGITVHSNVRANIRESLLSTMLGQSCDHLLCQVSKRIN